MTRFWLWSCQLHFWYKLSLSFPIIPKSWDPVFKTQTIIVLLMCMAVFRNWSWLKNQNGESVSSILQIKFEWNKALNHALKKRYFYFILCYFLIVWKLYGDYVSPLEGSGDILFFPFLSVCLSVTKSCLLYNLKTIRDISKKLHTFVKHIQMMCHAKKP